MSHQRCRALLLGSQSFLVIAIVASSLLSASFAFIAPPNPMWTRRHTMPLSRPFFSGADTLYALPDIDSMKAGEMRKELESYGISTKSFFEKKEFKEALKKARSEGKKPKAQASTSSSSSEKKKSASGSTNSRDERIKEEMEKAKKMKISELRKELKDMGISTKSFFEKSEFVKALAEARVDGVKSPRGGGARVQEEDYDPSYRDVVMQKFKASPRELVGSPVIEIQLR